MLCEVLHTPATFSKPLGRRRSHDGIHHPTDIISVRPADDHPGKSLLLRITLDPNCEDNMANACNAQHDGEISVFSSFPFPAKSNFRCIHLSLKYHLRAAQCR